MTPAIARDLGWFRAAFLLRSAGLERRLLNVIADLGFEVEIVGNAASFGASCGVGVLAAGFGGGGGGGAALPSAGFGGGGVFFSDNGSGLAYSGVLSSISRK